MAYTPKINIRGMKKMGVILNENEFFRLISAECNHIDQDLAKAFYKGMVQVITRELKTKRVVNLPHLGYFSLIKQQDSFGWIGKTQGLIKGKHLLKFYPNENWREYFTDRLKGEQ